MRESDPRGWVADRPVLIPFIPRTVIEITRRSLAFMTSHPSSPPRRGKERRMSGMVAGAAKGREGKKKQ